ncbi:hypothetical protein IM40_05900 [Candidatus Paracaedimonas acanthamoebae]|nr:hypothetical protein IM40_05900 [Candidatus Paracaedimonas acanthamoebae]
MLYLPHEALSIRWLDNNTKLSLKLPWLSMEIEVDPQEKAWIEKAINLLHTAPLKDEPQRFIKELKDYPLFYYKPRLIEEFHEQDLQSSKPFSVDYTSPLTFFNTAQIPADASLQQDILQDWTWEWGKILDKCRIDGTELYDPLSAVSYLICYRLQWESTTWSGQDGLGKKLEEFLKEDEHKFFKAIGWISKQSYFITKNFCDGLKPALTYFPKATDLIEHFINDEIGHHKFMEQVFNDLNLNKDDLKVGPATKWTLAAHQKMATLSPLAFSAMINLFEAAFYEGQDPISRVIKKSSKPEAARGYDLHYKINQEHRHCDMPIILAQRLAPQPKEHILLTLAIFELTLNFLDQMEKRLDEYIKI